MNKAAQWLKRAIPKPILRPVLTWRSKRLASRRFQGHAAQAVFTEIFRTNYWGSEQSVSGIGSEAATTRDISAALPQILRRFELGSMLDAPCGDFSWMQHVDLGSTRYIGGDIVLPLIKELEHRHGAANRRFMALDLTVDPLPDVELIFCRDCFIHLPFEMINKALRNFANSSAKYVLTTTFQRWPVNYDTALGGARGVDLCAWPFLLPQPLELINDDLPRETGGVKCMGLWPISALQSASKA